MTRRERYDRKMNRQWIAMVLLFALAMTPITVGAAAFDYPMAPFGGGGGDGWTHVVRGYSFIPVIGGGAIGGLIEWLVNRAADYLYDHWNDPSGCGPGTCVGNASMGQPGAYGGGGGGAW